MDPTHPHFTSLQVPAGSMDTQPIPWPKQPRRGVTPLQMKSVFAGKSPVPALQLPNLSFETDTEKNHGYYQKGMLRG